MWATSAVKCCATQLSSGNSILCLLMTVCEIVAAVVSITVVDSLQQLHWVDNTCGVTKSGKITKSGAWVRLQESNFIWGMQTS